MEGLLSVNFVLTAGAVIVISDLVLGVLDASTAAVTLAVETF